MSTVEFNLRNMEALSVQHEPPNMLKPMSDEVKSALVMAPDKDKDPKTEYVTRKLRIASITDENHLDKAKLVNRAWEQLLLQVN